MNSHRIDLLDSFRFLAVMSVLLYHFTFRWGHQYPNGTYYGDLFKYGYLGVNFFFIISGFVISYTLENTADFKAFFKNRFIRLFPPLLLCTLITFGAAALLDKDNLFSFAHRSRNLLPSLTITNPRIWELLTKGNFAWINGSYWSLWVELQFYVIASTLYFLGKKNFFRNMLFASLALSVIKYSPTVLLNTSWGNHLPGVIISFIRGWRFADELFNICFYILWFALGVICHQLYKGLPFRGNSFLYCCIAIVLCLLYTDRFVYSGWLLHLLMAGLFGLLIYKRRLLSFLDIPLFKRIGVISYSIYLIHEVIGVLLIDRFGGFLGWSPLIPLLVIILTILFAELSYRFYEKRSSILLKKIL
jgi:peptidoglycan/LPS O-acetylase OafA/YrhL